jgi:hypothetical protein
MSGWFFYLLNLDNPLHYYFLAYFIAQIKL